MMTWTVAAPAISAAFLGSLVEAVEALTIVLAVGTVRGWRPAGLGAVAGLALLALIVLALGPLLDRVPLKLLQLAIGVLLLLFGMRWLRKAILRAAGGYPPPRRSNSLRDGDGAAARARKPPHSGLIGSLLWRASRPSSSKDWKWCSS
jgi:uncharacterized membrane protein